MAALLERHGVGKGERVAFAAANVPAYPSPGGRRSRSARWCRASTAGGRPAELAYGIELTRPKVLVADARRLERLKEVGLPDGLVRHRGHRARAAARAAPRR